MQARQERLYSRFFNFGTQPIDFEGAVEYLKLNFEKVEYLLTRYPKLSDEKIKIEAEWDAMLDDLDKGRPAAPIIMDHDSH